MKKSINYFLILSATLSQVSTGYLFLTREKWTIAAENKSITQPVPQLTENGTLQLKKGNQKLKTKRTQISYKDPSQLMADHLMKLEEPVRPNNNQHSEVGQLLGRLSGNLLIGQKNIALERSTK
ncbi:hypothetical protein ACPBEH_06395 [Latilactobacillus sp. 5-91]|uniref:Uncharacterized protein n=1 Tax=Latilactobacillus sakei TaxID=1599 RepID=A0AAF0GR17_LATSK|nr:hypothetical protein [Latilactobacillus sakei]WGI19438.1 hypothetical protein QBD03_01440 [Latilactobacillus sakei]